MNDGRVSGAVTSASNPYDPRNPDRLYNAVTLAINIYFGTYFPRPKGIKNQTRFCPKDNYEKFYTSYPGVFVPDHGKDRGNVFFFK